MGGRQIVYGTLAIAAGDYPAGGFTINWKSVPDIKSSKDPVSVQFVGKAGYRYVWDRAAGKVQIFEGDNNNAADGPGIVIPTAATPAGIVADVIDFVAVFKALV